MQALGAVGGLGGLAGAVGAGPQLGTATAGLGAAQGVLSAGKTGGLTGGLEAAAKASGQTVPVAPTDAGATAQQKTKSFLEKEFIFEEKFGPGGARIFLGVWGLLFYIIYAITPFTPLNKSVNLLGFDLMFLHSKGMGLMKWLFSSGWSFVTKLPFGPGVVANSFNMLNPWAIFDLLQTLTEDVFTLPFMHSKKVGNKPPEQPVQQSTMSAIFGFGPKGPDGEEVKNASIGIATLFLFGMIFSYSGFDLLKYAPDSVRRKGGPIVKLIFSIFGAFIAVSGGGIFGIPMAFMMIKQVKQQAALVQTGGGGGDPGSRIPSLAEIASGSISPDIQPAPYPESLPKTMVWDGRGGGKASEETSTEESLSFALILGILTVGGFLVAKLRGAGKLGGL
jgi:hypothetical protein